MITAANRTVVVVPPWTQIYAWPVGNPDDFLDYSLDLTAALAETTDTILSAMLAVAPSGTGELVASNLTFSGGIVTGWLTGGVAGRIYTVRIDVSTKQDRIFSFYVRLPLDVRLATFPIIPPLVAGYGTPIST